MPKRLRRFNRIKLKASVLVTLEDGHSFTFQCVDFSEDGIDIAAKDGSLIPANFNLKVGMIIQIQFDQVQQAPVTKAAVVKTSKDRIGLRLI
jgi:hypothetical protein